MLQEEKMFFAEHLALMLKGGVPLNEALETLKENSQSRRFKKAINDILKRILEGEGLSQAMAFCPNIFDRFYRDIIKIGEESGTLEENLNYLSIKLRKDNEMGTKVMAALLYPLIVIVMAVAMSLGIILFILPKLTTLFQALKVSLPLATRILIYSVSFSQKYWAQGLIAILIIIVFFRLIRRIKTVRFFFDKITLSFPIIGKVLKNTNISFFAHTFYILLKSGVPILTSLEIISETLPNEVYRRGTLKIKEKVERGERISKGMASISNLFPPVFSEMVLVGEKSGNLEESLLYLASHYERQVDSALKNLSDILGPILIVLVGLFVGFIAVAIITPIYKVVGQMKPR